MSEENDRKLYAHYKGVIAGSHSTGNSVSNELRVSDAKRHLADLIKKTKKRSPNFILDEAEAKAEEARLKAAEEAKLKAAEEAKVVDITSNKVVDTTKETKSKVKK